MSNQNDYERLAVGLRAREYMGNNEVNPEVTQKLFSHVKSFYCQLVSTMLNKFPFHDKVLQSIGFLNPETRDTVSATDVGALSNRFQGHDKKEMSVVMEEYKSFCFIQQLTSPLAKQVPLQQTLIELISQHLYHADLLANVADKKLT